MFSGERINRTDNRAVLHTALRGPRDASAEVDGQKVVPCVYAVLDRWRTAPILVVARIHAMKKSGQYARKPAMSSNRFGRLGISRNT